MTVLPDYLYRSHRARDQMSVVWGWGGVGGGGSGGWGWGLVVGLIRPSTNR